MILWIKSVVEAARNPPSVVYATITSIRNKKDNNENSGNDLQHLFLIAIAVAEERWDGNGIVAGVRIAADTFGNDQPVNVCTNRKSDGSPPGV